MGERENLEAGIAAMEAQRALLGDAVVAAALAPMREKLAALLAPPPEEQRKLLTVLFADVSGFTALSETRDAEDVRELMNRLWARLDAVLQAHGARIDKHIGDAVMALFGADAAREDDPDRAVRAALALQEALTQEAAILVEGTPNDAGVTAPPLRMRVGLSTGPVLLGSVGTVGETTALGDTVNVASRLEGAAPVGGVLIAHDTYRHVRGLFDVRELPPLALKGKAEPVRAYLVERAKPRGFRLSPRGVAGVETPMVGRESELRRLQEACEAALEEGTAQAVTVVGEAGVGKSRLLAEFEGWLDLQPTRVWYFKGRARAETAALPYVLVRDLLAYRFAIAESDSAAVAREKLEEGIRDLLGGGEAVEEIAPLLGHLIGLEYSAHPALHGLVADARALRARAVAAAARLFTTLARVRPVVLLLEDIHWADDGALDLLAHVARAGRDAPLLLVFLTRPTLFERRPSWGEGQEGHQRVDLRPLSKRDTRRLAAALLGKLPDAPAALLELVAGGAEGNPFYVEETVQMLVDDGVLVPGAEVWALRAERLAEVRVPPTLAGVLQARLDGLPAAERETLQRASVVGRVFWEGLVAHLEATEGGLTPDGAGGADGTAQSEPPEELAAATGARLAQLRGKELVYRREESAVVGTAEYLFKHALLRDVAYESVLRRKRRGYHGVVAAWLERRGGERTDEVAGLIAEHYAQAGEDAKAGLWALRAGERARATDAPAAAITAYERALALLPTYEAHGGTRLAAEEGLGDVLALQARYPEARAAYGRMREAARAAGDGAAEARAWLGAALAGLDQGDYAGALREATRAEVAAQAAGADVERARALHRQGFVLHRQGQHEQALARGEEALGLAAGLGARAEMAAAFNVIGNAYAGLGRLEEAERAYMQGLALAREVGDRRLTGVLVGNLGSNAGTRGDARVALPYFEEALATAREIGDRRNEILDVMNVGWARSRLGEHAAERDLRRAIALAEEAGAIFNLAVATGMLADELLGQGRADEAREAALRALALARQLGDADYTGGTWETLGQVVRLAGASVTIDGVAYGADDCFAESLRVLREASLEGPAARTLRTWAKDLWAQGERKRAVALWGEARDIFTRLGMAPELVGMADQPGDDPAT